MTKKVNLLCKLVKVFALCRFEKIQSKLGPVQKNAITDLIDHIDFCQGANFVRNSSLLLNILNGALEKNLSGRILNFLM